MRFNNIQALRIVAATTVVFSHLVHYAQFQFHSRPFPFSLFGSGSWSCVPVPLFFAISGFVLTHAIQTARPGPFLLARAVRLYPGYWLATLLCALAISLTGWPYSVPLWTHLKVIGWTLRPGDLAFRHYILCIEWSLVFEVMLSVSLMGMSLLGVRRGLPIATAIWLVAIGVKIALWPGYAMNLFPTWKTFAISPLNIPFLLGILTYYVRDRGKQWRWVVLTFLVAYLTVVPSRFAMLESHWCVYGFAAAVATWLAVQFRQLQPSNPLVVAGEYSYGLYLVHVPLMMGTFAILLAKGWLLDSVAGVCLAGGIALVFGLLYGRFEAGMHRKLRPLTRMQFAMPSWLGSLRTRVRV